MKVNLGKSKVKSAKILKPRLQIFVQVYGLINQKSLFLLFRRKQIIEFSNPNMNLVLELQILPPSYKMSLLAPYVLSIRSIKNTVLAFQTITKKGTNPNYKEFIMVPQKALLGTAKPIVGTLIYENPPFWSNIDHLANLSHSLCYMHEVSTAPISCPAPLRSAEQLAQRGKNNWVTNRNQNSDTTSSTSSNNYQQMSSDEKDVYMARLGEHFDDLTNILKPTLECKFWA